MSLKFATNIISLSSRLVRPRTTATFDGLYYWQEKSDHRDRRDDQTQQIRFRSRNFSSSSSTRIPNLEHAKAMRPTFPTMKNETLTIIAETGNHEAGSEVLKRHIMSIDNVDYQTACATFARIEKVNHRTDVRTIPYFLGIGVGVYLTAISLPMLTHDQMYDFTTSQWVDVPDAFDGTLMFMLVCLQFARAQIKNLGLKPYTKMVIHQRAKRLANQFPKYDSEIIHMYSKTEPLINNSWLYKRKGYLSSLEVLKFKKNKDRVKANPIKNMVTIKYKDKREEKKEKKNRKEKYYLREKKRKREISSSKKRVKYWQELNLKETHPRSSVTPTQ